MSFMRRLRNLRNGYDHHGYDDEGPDRRWMAPGGLLLVAIVGVVAFGPQLGSAIASSLRHDDGAAPTVATTAQTPPSSEPATSTTGPLVASEPPVPPLTARPVITSPVATAAPQPHIAVTALQTVPPVRDVIVDIGGVEMATDALGQLSVGELDDWMTIEIVGRDANPTLQQVTFTAWSDDDVSKIRAIRNLQGPVATIGVEISSRVVVEVVTADGTAVREASVAFDSPVGPVSLVAGAPQWLPAARAVPSAGGLVPQELTYTPTSVTLSDGTVHAATAQTLAATPEVLWQVVIAP